MSYANRKPNGPLQGQPPSIPPSAHEDNIDFDTLQLAIDALQWKQDPHFLDWIFNEYLKLVEARRDPPTDFGTDEFWDAVWPRFGLDDSQRVEDDPIDREIDDAFDQQSGGRMNTARPPPVIAGTEAASHARLVNYSDSEDEYSQSQQPSQQQGPSTSASSQQQQQQSQPDLGIDDYYELSTPVRTYVRKFKVHGSAYFLRFRNQDRMDDLHRILTGIFERVLDKAFAEGDDTDMVGVQFKHPGLKRGYFSMNFNRQSQMTADRVLAMWEYLMEYDDELNVDENLDIVFTRIPQMRGGRPQEHKWNHRAWMRKHCSGHGSCFIQVSNPDDNLCLARALVVAKARIDRQTDPVVAGQWNTIRQGDKNRHTLQKRLAKQLMRAAGLQDHDGECGEEEIRKLQAALEPEYQIKIFSAQCCNFLTFQGKVPAAKVLHLYHDVDEEGNSGHFLVMSRPHVLFNREYWCDRCNKAHNDQRAHKCTGKCYCCFSINECPLVQWKYCDDCRRWFRSEECFEKHKSVVQRRGVGAEGDQQQQNKRQKQNKSLCEKIKRCEKCKRLLNYTKMKKTRNGDPLHNCGMVYCRNCDTEHLEGVNDCYIQPIREKEKEKLKKSPLETVHQEASEGSEEEVDPEMDPNSIDAIVRDHEQRQDAAEMEIGTDLSEEDRDLLDVLSDLHTGEESAVETGPMDAEMPETDLDERDTKIFFDFECRQERQVGENNLGPIFAHEPNLCVAMKVCNLCKEKVKAGQLGTCRFCGQNKWIFWGPDCRDRFCRWLFKEDNRGAIAIAHNSKGYDSQFIMQYLIRETLVPKVICKGLELMMLEYGGIRVIDSLNFLPMSLADLPKAFDETELKKGYFPHRFNTDRFANYKGPMPDAWYYDPGNMKTEKRQAFYTWYSKQLGKEFDFETEILQYCESDVDILMKCCLKFEDLFQQVTGVKPFNVSITIASACMHVFRKNFLKPHTIGIVPHGGYMRRENQSNEALRWLKWISAQEGINIQHARNGGEKRIGKYLVDGFDQQTNTVYEYHGCIWHGCPRCYTKRDRKVPTSDKTLDDVYQNTMTKTAFLRQQGYTVVEKWACEVKKELAENPEMSTFFEELWEIPQPLDHREALRGGRTNATRLYYRCGPNEYMSFVDVCSLYPWGVKWTKFPVGHPEIYTENFEPITAARNPYFGLIKCTVLPPRKLLHPVLPYKCNGKLLFPLCRQCAHTQRQRYCNHLDEDRALRGVWVTTELNKALKMGYKIVKIHEVWHYKESEQHDGKDEMTGLFTRYINCFLKLKIEASGWPSWVKTEADQEQFIKECEQREGIHLNPENIKKNAGLRSLAKLCLNSFWGKFGQRTNMAKDEFVCDPAKFSEIMFDETNIVEQVRVMSEEMLYVTYSKEENYVELMSHTNPVIAAFTTANCRLRLYEELEKLQERVCYFDTDSVIYVTRPGDKYHPKLGSFLGDMTNELADYGEGAVIDEFISGGPKNYAYRVRKPDGKAVSKVKIRGFTLNHHAAARLNRRRLRQMVAEFVEYGRENVEKPAVVQPQIQRTRKREVVTKDTWKEYGIVYDKRWIQDDYSTLPYGTCAR